MMDILVSSDAIRFLPGLLMMLVELLMVVADLID